MNEHPYFLAATITLGLVLVGCLAVLVLLGCWAWTGWRTATEKRRTQAQLNHQTLSAMAALVNHDDMDDQLRALTDQP